MNDIWRSIAIKLNFNSILKLSATSRSMRKLMIPFIDPVVHDRHEQWKQDGISKTALHNGVVIMESGNYRITSIDVATGPHFSAGWVQEPVGLKYSVIPLTIVAPGVIVDFSGIWFEHRSQYFVEIVGNVLPTLMNAAIWNDSEFNTKFGVIGKYNKELDRPLRFYKGRYQSAWGGPTGSTGVSGSENENPKAKYQNKHNTSNQMRRANLRR